MLSWSSADIVKGIFFYDGPITSLLTKEYYSNLPAITPEQRTVWRSAALTPSG